MEAALRYLKTNTAVIITVGPFYDKTDGVTIETALTITNERITLTADTDAGSAPTLILDNITGATAATANDLNYITNNDAGLMQLELAAADTNRLGRMFLTITDAANHVPVFHEFMVLPAVVYDAMILGTDLFDVSMTQILGTAVSSPATAGILDVNLKNIANATVSTSAAQIGVNAVQAGGTAWGSGAITAAAFAAGAVDAAAIANGAIDAATFAAGAIDAAALAADAGAELADAFLNRDMATGTDSGSTSVRTVRQALRALRNKWSVSAGTYVVTKEDDSTTSWSSTVTGTAGADPITTSDPAGP